MDEQISTQFGSRLEPLGFNQVHPRRWVRSTKSPIREIVQISAVEGSDPVACWGISFDFVPHEKDAHPAWHRTDATARLDLRVDPLDWNDRRAARAFRFSDSQASVVSAARATTKAATAWFDRIDDVESTLPLFDEARCADGNRFGFEHYPQQRLAHAFVLAHTGHEPRGYAELAIWIDGYGRNLPTENKVEFHDLLAAAG